MPKQPPRPQILITRAETVPNERWEDYAEAIARAGGEPMEGNMADWQLGVPTLAHDGLLLTSGVDIDPARYGEPRSDHVTRVRPARDAYEIELIDWAYAVDRPVLGICRGHQVLNVTRGGSLLQHLEEREPHHARRGEDGESIVSGWHEVEIQPGTMIHEVLGTDRLRVNSRHHQAVTSERVAPGLVVAAVTEDGVVEALVDPSRRWVASVQWHPEMPEASAPSRGIFEAFVRACADAREARMRSLTTPG